MNQGYLLMNQGNSTITLNKLENDLAETARNIQIKINGSKDPNIVNLGQTFQDLMVKCGLDNGKDQSEEEQGSQNWPWIILIVIWLVQLICDLFRQKEELDVGGKDNENKRLLISGRDIENSLVNLKKQIQACNNEKPLQETKEILSQMKKILEMVEIIKSSVFNSTIPISYESSVGDDEAYLDEASIQSPSVASSLLNDEIKVPISPMVNAIDSTEQKGMNDEPDRDVLTPQNSLPNPGTLALFHSSYTLGSNYPDNNDDTACLEKANDLVDYTIKLLTNIKPKLSATLWDKVSHQIDKIKKILRECNEINTLKSSFNRQKKHTLFLFHPDKYQNENNETQGNAKFIFQTFNTFFDQIKKLGIENDILDAFWNDLETRCQELFQSQEELRAFFDNALQEAREMERQADELLNDFKEIKESTRQMRKETQERIKHYDQMLAQVHQMRKDNQEELKKTQASIAKTEEDIAETKKDIKKTKERRKQINEKREHITSRLKALKERKANKPIQENHKSRSAPILKRKNIFLSQFSKRISDLKRKIDMRCNKRINKTSTSDTIYIHLLVTLKSTLSAVEGDQLNNRAVGLLLDQITKIVNKYQTNEHNVEFFQALKQLSESVLDLKPLDRYKAEFDNALAVIKENLYQQELPQYYSDNTNSRISLFSQSTPNLERLKENDCSCSMSKQHSV